MSEFLAIMPVTHLVYLGVSLLLVVWVARTLKKHGRIFITKGCKGNEELAKSLSHLLTVGFYLLHFGGVLLALTVGGVALDPTAAIELLSTKIGIVLIVLAVSHFLHLALYSRIHGKPRPYPEPLAGAYAPVTEIHEEWKS
jgi:hypothetical protein